MLDHKIVIDQISDGQTAIDEKLKDESVWLNAQQMSLLFDKENTLTMIS